MMGGCKACGWTAYRRSQLVVTMIHLVNKGEEIHYSYLFSTLREPSVNRKDLQPLTLVGYFARGLRRISLKALF